MKRFLLILAAAAALVCSCNNYDDEIDNLENRLDQTESTIEIIKSKVEALNTLLEAISNGISIKSVTPVKDGFNIVFSDGSSYTIVNGGDAQVNYTDDGSCYTFDFGDGNVVSVGKVGAFAIKPESDIIKLVPGEEKIVKFEVIGGDDSVKFLAEADAYEVEVADGEMSVYADKVQPGIIILKAIRNSDGATCAIVFTVEKKAIENVTIELSVTDPTATSAYIAVTPSNKNVFYLMNVDPKADYAGDPKEAAEAFIAEIEELYGEEYVGYGYSSFAELFTENFCYKGDIEGDFTGLASDTEYVAYACALDEETLDILTKEIPSVEFKTLGLGNYLGVATWHDVFVDEWFKLVEDGYPVDLPVDVYEDYDKKGVFYFDSPYNYANIAPWFDSTPEEMYQYDGNWKPWVVTIDASNPAEVHMDFQELGCCLSGDLGWFWAGAEYEGEALSTGTYENGVIAFTTPNGMLKAMDKYNDFGLYYANTSGTFNIIMPTGAPSAKACSARVEKTHNLKGGLKLTKTLSF